MENDELTMAVELTESELKIVREAMLIASNEEIAARLQLDYHPVLEASGRIFSKLNRAIRAAQSAPGRSRLDPTPSAGE